MKSIATEAYWQSYCTSVNLTGKEYEVVAFGDSPAMADELGHLIVHGPKRATAGLYLDFEKDLESLPHVGGHVVVIDGKGNPLCIFQTAEIRIGPLSSVDEQFAWDEGEGDRTRTWWLNAHTEFFQRQAEREGFKFTPDIKTVFERFKVVWPLAAGEF
jgi:uncharacterized protein YhfF